MKLMNLLNKKRSKEKINKSKKIIKKEKKKTKEKKESILKKIFKKKNKKEETITLKEQVFSMIYFEIIGAVLCLLILFALSGGKNYIKLHLELKKLIEVYDTINSNYYGDLDKEELIDAAIKSMIYSAGDNYTTYTDEDEENTLLEELKGTYEGIGCTVSMNINSQIIVINVFGDSPAEKSGLQAGDIITKIDNKDFSDKTSEDMANYVKESKNSKITVTILRNEEEKELIIKREKVEIPSVTSKIIEKDEKQIGYIDISVFSTVTYNQFKKQLEELEKQNIEGLIIDVRADTGGYLSAVTDICNLFLEKGQVIYQLEDAKKIEKVKDTTKEKREYPVAVLINQLSASASEILASTIKESYGGLVIGTNSYGKGTVQKTKTLSDGSMIKYTTQKWLTPEGNWINEIGVEPTIVVELELTNGVDNQLEVALTEIIKEIN